MGGGAGILCVLVEVYFSYLYIYPPTRGTKESISHYHETLGENLLGVELEFSGLDIKFKSKSAFYVFSYLFLITVAAL